MLKKSECTALLREDFLLKYMEYNDATLYKVNFEPLQAIVAALNNTTQETMTETDKINNMLYVETKKTHNVR